MVDTTVVALCICMFISSSYVFSLYLIPARIRSKSRDDPVHMKYRMVASSIATCGCALMVVGYMCAEQIAGPQYSMVAVLGLRLDSLVWSVVQTLGLMTMFYVGPLIAQLWTVYAIGLSDIDYEGRTIPRKETGMVSASIRDANRARLDYLRGVLRGFTREDRLFLFRNLVFAPLSEEVAFRALMLPLLHPAFSCGLGWSTTAVALLNPAFFSCAHLHHIYEKLRSGHSVKAAVLSTLLQMMYTGIFGFVAAMLLLLSGNLAAPVTAHIICNCVGLPDIGFMFSPGHANSSLLSHLYAYRHFHFALHIGGLVLFSFSLFPMMAPFATDNPFLHCS